MGYTIVLCGGWVALQKMGDKYGFLDPDFDVRDVKVSEIVIGDCVVVSMVSKLDELKYYTLEECSGLLEPSLMSILRYAWDLVNPQL